jgi:hypothetical protein
MTTERLLVDVARGESFAIGDEVSIKPGDYRDCTGRPVEVDYSAVYRVVRVVRIDGSLPVYYRVQGEDVADVWRTSEAAERLWVAADRPG